MAHIEQREFCSKMKEQYPEYFVGKKVLDIGSLDINGNNRFLFTDCNYIGLDVGEGPNVDVVSVGHLYDGPNEYFDTIISTEVFEHDMFYEKTIQNIIRMLKPGGAFVFTCASTGRPEHGTRRCGEHCAPLLIQISEEWADYYKNLVDSDFLAIDGFKEAFPDGFFIYNGESEIPGDIYFFGVKGGIQKTRKFLPIKVDPQIHNGEYRPEEYKDDIFVIGAWPDTEEKETDLINCITRLRQFYGIPILLVSHYAIKPEIQKLVDYYIFDKDNDILKNEEFAEHDVASGRWTQMNDHRVENQMEFHHDYAIWVSMKHAFNFCKYLGKSQVHYLEYDNIVDIFQYRQSFLERSKNVDAVLYEYNENSIKDLHFAPFCATFIFSAKTDVLIKMMSEVNSKKEYFMNRPKGWQLERLFLHYLQTHTNNYTVSPYIANDNELNTKAVWNRDGIFREGAAFQIYPCVDLNDQLYIHLISGFHETDETDDLLLELRYGDNFKFEKLKSKEYKTIHLGEYRKGMTIRVHLFGKEVFTHFLVDNVEKFRTMNKVLWNDERKIVKENPMKNGVNINFVDGGFIEILGIHKEKYLVKFIDKKTTEVVFQTNLQNNQWAKVDRKWFTDWKIELHREGGTPIFYDYDAKDKRVFVVFESSSLGDTIAWLPYVEEFRKKHNCKMIVSTFLNNLFQNQYPDIEFVKPGATVHNLYALYRLGIFLENEQFEPSKHKTDYKKLRLQQVATDILGLEFEEIRPMISKPKPMKSKKPYICIANHSTAQSKYWNNPTGWQELVDYVKELGYDVYLLSKEEDGYMGNKNPNGVIKVDGKSLEEISSILLGSKGFVGISSGLSWLAWSLGVPTALISGCTEEVHEPSQNVQRVINTNVCNSCFSNHTFDKGDWNWCPLHKGTEREFECSKEIPFSMVRPSLDKILGI